MSDCKVVRFSLCIYVLVMARHGFDSKNFLRQIITGFFYVSCAMYMSVVIIMDINIGMHIFGSGCEYLGCYI